MTDVGDAIELIYATAPNSTVTMSWIHRDSATVEFNNVPVPERLADDASPTGLFPITVVGNQAGLWEARFTATGASENVESFFERFSLSSSPIPLATITEYQDLYGELSAPRQATARALLLRASAIIRAAFPRVDEKILDGSVNADVVSMVAINMVAQVMRNPAGLRSETTGPFSRSYDPEAASGMLQLTEADRDLLGDAGLGGASGRKGKFGTARVSGGMVPSSRPGRRWPRGAGGTFPSGW
jgi:Phage protein Gp19/Gp15/Gp42